ncbi:hypothetical protein AB433_01170 [Croceicoccus naphthovorans]|uniref:Protein kinase n=1 Tax=Croceicoccus naphthovorans TaxID=1348774 RepID=A0A0G3XE70_9SPHN|nr:hypothetical protein AB433_01170 [Croceicoccus naphthovorans]
MTPGSRALSVSIGQHSTAGSKPENQDFHGCWAPDGDDLVTKGVAVAIADGISTSALGAAAAETAVKSFLSDYYSTSGAWSVRQSGERVIAATNSWMHAQNTRHGPTSDESREAEGLICTLSAMVLKSRSAHLFHVGDAQIARIVGTTLEPLTQPHRVSAGGGKFYLARAMGVTRNVQIDYVKVAVQPGDLFVLTTDGIHEALSGNEIAKIIIAADTLDDAARALCDAALAAGSDDNLTAQLVRIETLPSGEITDLVGADAALPPAPHLEAGEQFEGYRVLRRLYTGSRSQVYLVRDELTGAKAVMKVPSTEHGSDPAQLSALMLEEWVMRRMAHQNVLAPPPGPQRARQHLFAVSSFVEGQSLDEWIADHPAPELNTVRDIVRQIASGLLAMHRKEMVHRDLRPKNVMIDGDGTVTIIDFGSTSVAGIEELAPGTAGEAIFAGTVQFAAPEVWLGEDASAQSDIYSLGVIAYHMLTGGELPYGPRLANATTPAAQKKLKYRPITETAPDVPAWMDAAIARACAIDPTHRYTELSEFTYDLAHPNRALVTDTRTLMERGTANDWRTIAMLLAVALVLAILTRPDLALS